MYKPTKADIAWGQQSLGFLRKGNRVIMPGVGAELVLFNETISITNTAPWYDENFDRPRLKAIFRILGVKLI